MHLLLAALWLCPDHQSVALVQLLLQPSVPAAALQLAVCSINTESSLMPQQELSVLRRAVLRTATLRVSFPHSITDFHQASGHAS